MVEELGLNVDSGGAAASKESKGTREAKLGAPITFTDAHVQGPHNSWQVCPLQRYVHQ